MEKKEIVISFVGVDASGKPRIVKLRAPLRSDTLKLTVEDSDSKPEDIVRAYFKDNEKKILVCDTPELKSSIEFKDVSGIAILIGIP